MKHLGTWAAAAALLVAFQASATVNCNNPNQKKLKFFSGDTGTIGWQKSPDDFGIQRSDSPNDTDHGRLIVHVLIQHCTAVACPDIDAAGAYNDCTGIENRLVGQVRNLSFDVKSGPVGDPLYIGAGAPRYSVEIDPDGDNTNNIYAYLSSLYCKAPTSDPDWSRSDFTGNTTAGECTFYANGLPFTSDGTRSAWKVMADANPTWKVKSAFFVFDEAGTNFVDNLAFHNRAFRTEGTNSAAIKNCPNEASC